MPPTFAIMVVSRGDVHVTDVLVELMIVIVYHLAVNPFNARSLWSF